MSEYTPLPEGTKVLAITEITHDDRFGHTMTHTMPAMVWAYPLDDDVVEALAEAGFEALYKASGNPFVYWGSSLLPENTREHWRIVVEAIFAKLMGGDV